MGTENRVVLELLQSHSSLVSTNPVLKLGQKVYATGIATDYYPYKIGDGVTAYNSLEFADNPRRFGNERIDSQELVSGALSVSGWYTIAETEDTGGLISSAEFKVTDIGGGILGCKVSVAESTNPKTHINTTIKLIESAANTTGTVNQVTSYRLAKSAVNGAGFKLQAQLSPSSARVFYIQMFKNFSRGSGKGFFLVAPYLDNTPTLPDGVTVGTFLEAGDELSFDGVTVNYPTSFTSRVESAHSVYCCVTWEDIPKQGTGITLTLPATLFQFRQGTISGAVTGAHSTSNLLILGKKVYFRISEVGAFASLTPAQIAFPEITGTGCKLTIT